MGRVRESMGGDDGDMSIDISPLLDCVFILLIFFIVTTTFIEESGVGVEPPQPASPTDQESENVVLELDANGRITHEGREIGFGGIRPLVSQAVRGSDSAVVVRAAKSASTGSLVRVVDEVRLSGAETVSVATISGSE